MGLVKKIVVPFLITVLSYWAIQPLLNTGFFPMHDDTQVARVFVMHNALIDGAIPVRWIAGLGYNYGYPLFNFYAPLAYYVGGFLAFFTDVLTATKIMMALGVVVAGVGMYLFAKEFWGKIGGALAGILYVYAPYHALDIYVRGDVAEFWAYAFIPFAFWGIYKVYLQCQKNILTEISKNRKRQIIFAFFTQESWLWVSVAAIFYAGIILSHNLSALMITPFLLVFVILLSMQKHLTKRYLLFVPFVLGALLSAFYWLPVPVEMQYTNVLSQVGGGADYKDHFVCLRQLWDSPWAYGGSTHDCQDGLSFRIGKIHIALTLFAFISLFSFWKSQKEKFMTVLFIFISLFITLFLMVPQSRFVWDAIKPMAFFQYPWRFLLLVSFFVSFLGGSTIFVLNSLLKGKFTKVIWIIVAGLIGFCIYFNAKVFVPQIILQKTVADYTNNKALMWTASKLTDEYMPKGFSKPKRLSDIPTQKLKESSDIKIISLKETTQGMVADIDIKKQTRIILSYAYFPALHMFIDNKEVGFTYSEQGIFITVPKGEHFVSVQYIQTPIEIASNLLSLTGVLLVILGIISTRRKHKNAKKSY